MGAGEHPGTASAVTGAALEGGLSLQRDQSEVPTDLLLFRIPIHSEESKAWKLPAAISAACGIMHCLHP